MRLDHEERKAKADEKAAPEFYYSYVLRFEDDGSFYVGSTNNPAARFTEHAVGVGAVATSGRRFSVCLVHQFGSRKEAEIGWEKRTPKSDKIERRRCQYERCPSRNVHGNSARKQ